MDSFSFLLPFILNFLESSLDLNDALSESSLQIDTPPAAARRKRTSFTPRTSSRKRLRPDDENDSIFIDFELPVTPNRSQKVLSKIDSGSILQSQHTKAFYVLREQRSMVARNEDNVFDEDFSVVHNEPLYTDRHQKELDAAFEACEKTIVQPPDVLNGISRIDWDEGVPQLQTQSSHGRVQLAPVSSSTFPERGPFFGLPAKVKTLIQEFKGIDQLYDWQIECLRLPSVLKRENLIYALPTSGGKTLVAEILMLREVICRQKNALFILPFVSLVQEKVLALSPFAVGLEFLVEEYAAGKGNIPPKKRRKKNSIFIASIEKGLMLLDSLIAEKRAAEIGLIVVDELHLLGERGRGGTLESLLTKAMLLNCGIQIVGMSATIGNLNEVAEFLNADIYTRDFRPVELKEYLKVGRELQLINSAASSREDVFQQDRVLDFEYSAEALKLDPDFLAGLVQEVIPEESCLIFCSTKENCERVAELLVQMFSPDLKLHRSEEKRELLAALQRDIGELCPILRKTLPYGIAYHHSGLTTDERRHIEDAYRCGVICVICCTSTLAAGVNLPAKRVILRSPYVGRDFINLSRYKQMAGRAGRAGHTSCGESILICSSKDYEKVGELLFSPMDEAITSLQDLESLQSFLLSTIELEMAKNRDEVQKLTRKTLLGVQANRLKINLKGKVDETLKKLYKVNALSAVGPGAPKPKNVSVIIESSQEYSQTLPPPPTETRSVVKIKGRTPLQISRLGKASIKACVTLQRGTQIYQDLQEAAKHLILNNYLHLLYLAVPYDTSETVSPNYQKYHDAYAALREHELTTARVIGLTEARARNMLRGKKFDEDLERRLKRFFVALVLYDLWNGRSIQQVHLKYKLPRGTVQNLMQSAANTASAVHRFCEEFDELWPFRQLLAVLTKRLQYCCAAELLPLMDLPAVKLARAKQLYGAGYKDLKALAGAKADELVQKIDHMNHKVAKQLILAAKVSF